MKRITVAVCVDDRGGMTFFGKRQSRDRVLISELCESVQEKIYIHPYSKLLFEPHEERYVSADNPIDACPDGGICFIENISLAEHADVIETVILYKWNRVYPFDKKLDLALDGFSVECESEFVGSSHDKITKLILRRK